MADKKAETKKVTKSAAKDTAPKAEKASAPAAATKAPAKKSGTPKGKKVPTGKVVKVTQIGSPIGRQKYQLQTLIGLGLNKMHRSRVLEDTPSVRGMIEAVKHLVKVEDAA